MTRKRLLFVVVAMAVTAASLVLYRSAGWAQYRGPIGTAPVDLARPDALIRTRSLSQLPRDLLKVALFRDLLTEELVFYYEEHPDRLGLKGTLRRIAYEHALQLQDQILAWAFDQPADVALWRDGKGRLRYWLAAMSRKDLAKVMQEAATVAMKDRQLTLAASVTVDGKPVDVYALEYASRRTLLFASRGDRVVVMSDPALLLKSDRAVLPEAEAVVRKLLSAEATPAAPYRDAFQLDAQTPKHSVLLHAHYLSFGYQHFFPGVEALRFDFGDKGWSSHALLDPAKLPAGALKDRDLWAAFPANPAACALLPVAWQMGQSLLERAPEHEGSKPVALLAELDGPAAVCWYGSGRLHTPLFVATLKSPRDDLTPLFQGLFEWSIAKSEEDAPVEVNRRAPDETLWQRAVQAPYVGDGEEGARSGSLTVTLARKGRFLLFSPDEAQVEQAVATLSRRYPPLAEQLPAKAITLAVLVPKSLAELGRKEALFMLPSGSEALFRGVAQARLLPRLDALAKYPPYRLALSAAPASRGWQPVEWQELRK
jgi:uncharacterized protein YfaA (DUF2138 family)